MLSECLFSTASVVGMRAPTSRQISANLSLLPSLEDTSSDGSGKVFSTAQADALINAVVAMSPAGTMLQLLVSIFS